MSTSATGDFVTTQPRSGCPINVAVEAFGDRWTLLVPRDVMFGNRRHFRELQVDSEPTSRNRPTRSCGNGPNSSMQAEPACGTPTWTNSEPPT
jgi:hypothetical protein